MEYSLKRVHTGKDLAISSTILLAGIGLFFVNKGLGICIGICGVLMCLFYKGGYMISATTTMNLRPASSNSMATGRKN